MPKKRQSRKNSVEIVKDNNLLPSFHENMPTRSSVEGDNHDEARSETLLFDSPRKPILEKTKEELTFTNPKIKNLLQDPLSVPKTPKTQSSSNLSLFVLIPLVFVISIASMLLRDFVESYFVGNDHFDKEETNYLVEKIKMLSSDLSSVKSKYSVLRSDFETLRSIEAKTLEKFSAVRTDLEKMEKRTSKEIDFGSNVFKNYLDTFFDAKITSFSDSIKRYLFESSARLERLQASLDHFSKEDKTDKIDVASFYNGGRVFSSSKVLFTNNFWLNSLVPIFMTRKERSKIINRVLKFGNKPGKCLVLEGQTGFVEIKFESAVLLKTLSYEHTSTKVLKNLDSMPSKIAWIGFCKEEKDDDAFHEIIIGTMVYEGNGIQEFMLEKSLFCFKIKMEVISNNGAPITCLYRIRAHEADDK